MENTLYPRIVNGFRDLDATQNDLRWKIIEAARKVYQLYGFEHLDTPLMEYAEAIGKYMPDEDTVDKGVYSFANPELEPNYQPNGREVRDENGQVIMNNHPLALRYDLTAPLARHYAEKYYQGFLKKQYAEGRTPLFRRFAFGPVFRYEIKPAPGRYREFWQLDFDTVGTADVSADAEVCMVLCDALEAIGLERDTFVVKVNNRKVLKGFLQNIGVTDHVEEENILRIFDKLDKIGWEAMISELGEGREDSSGAPIKGLGLPQNQVDSIVAFLKGFEGVTTRKAVTKQLRETLTGELGEEGITELEKIDQLLEDLGFDDSRVSFDPTLIRGMAYYTGPVFEVESLLTYKDRKGKTKKVGSICGGGRYDGLVENLLGIKVPATGASIGVSRLAALLMLTNKAKAKIDGPVLIAYFDDNLSVEYQKMARELRAAGISTEVYCGFYKGFRKMKKQLSYADEKNCPLVVLMGENEAANRTVSVKNLQLGAAIADQISDKGEFKARVQKEIKREDLIAHIQSELAANKSL